MAGFLDSDSEEEAFYPTLQSVQSSALQPPIQTPNAPIQPYSTPIHSIPPSIIQSLDHDSNIEANSPRPQEIDDAMSISTNDAESRASIGHDSFDSNLDHEDLIKATLAAISVSDTHLPVHLRPMSPADLTVELMQHQLVGLDWLTEQENVKGRGGILADVSNHKYNT